MYKVRHHSKTYIQKKRGLTFDIIFEASDFEEKHVSFEIDIIFILLDSSKTLNHLNDKKQTTYKENIF